MASIKKETFDFLRQLKLNNNREWFNENKELYQNALENFKEVVDEIIEGIAEFDSSVEQLEAKNCVFRIYRDTRFSKDKTPYKTNMGASLSKGSKTLNIGGYYIHLDTEESFIAGGVYMTEPKNLKAIRQEISSNSEEFLKIISKKSFQENLRLDGEKLVKVPQGFDKADPMGEYLKLKQFTVYHSLTEKEVLSKDFVTNSVTIFKEIYPFNSFLNQAILEN